MNIAADCWLIGYSVRDKANHVASMRYPATLVMERQAIASQMSSDAKLSSHQKSFGGPLGAVSLGHVIFEQYFCRRAEYQK